MRPIGRRVFSDSSVWRVYGCVATVVAMCAVTPAFAQWPQWGGPNRNFTIETTGLADKWPEGGPRRVWHRELGDGYSSIVADNGVLYTMYRQRTNEFSVALDAKTGRTIWEHEYASPRRLETEDDLVSTGPNSTPLLVQNRLYTIGTHSVIHCFDKMTGEVLWKRDLIKELGGCSFERGYSASPIAYKSLLITPVGRDFPGDHQTAEGGSGADLAGDAGKGSKRAPTLVALDQTTGKTVWQSQDFMIRYSSPIIISVGGEDQLVFLLAKGLLAVKPDSGELLWHIKFTGSFPYDMTPLWANGDTLVVAGGESTRAIRVKNEGGRTVAEEIWSSPKLHFPQNNPVYVNGYLYGSSGRTYQRGTVVCADIHTGKRKWAKRGFALATCVFGDEKLVILDENGQLGLATVTPEGMTLHSKCQITARESWTVPTLVGTTLYVRDRKHIMAFDLSATGNGGDG